MIVNKRITITAGTPIALATQSTFVRSLFVQMRHGGTGFGTLFNLSDPAVQGQTPDVGNGAHVSAELAPATATAPGGSWGYPDTDRGYDLQWISIDGSNSGDTVTVSYDKKV